MVLFFIYLKSRGKTNFFAIWRVQRDLIPNESLCSILPFYSWLEVARMKRLSQFIHCGMNRPGWLLRRGFKLS
jgi:hypothetical protein